MAPNTVSSTHSQQNQRNTFNDDVPNNQYIVRDENSQEDAEYLLIFVVILCIIAGYLVFIAVLWLYLGYLEGQGQAILSNLILNFT